MVSFLVTVGLVCGLPFVVAMLKRGIRRSDCARVATNHVAGRGGRGQGVETRKRQYDPREYQFRPAIYLAALPGRWSRQHSLLAPTEDASFYGDLACPRLWLPSASAGNVSGRSDALESFFQQRQHWTRRGTWNCPI